MLKSIRNLNFGWILILVGIVVIVSGISMTDGRPNNQTFLCFDQGCIYIQGISNIAIGLLSVGLGVYLVLKKSN